MGTDGRRHGADVRGGDRRRPRRAKVIRLAVDARDALRDRRGIGRYVRELIPRFASRDDLVLTLLVAEPFPRFARDRYRALVGRDAFALARRPGRDCDVVWHPWNGTFFPAGAPAVATIHDVVPFAFPDPDPRKRESQQAPFRRSAAQSAAILTDSEFSAGEIGRHLGVPRERIHPVPLGVGPSFSPGAPAGHAGAPPGPYILVVGSGEAHKNVLSLARGAAAALAGRGTRLAALGVSLPAGDAFTSLEPVEESALADLYRGAVFLAAPALYEGFGLPLVEAMACGTPVVAARSGPYPEVCGEAAAYVDAPADPRAWASALGALLDDGARRAELRERGLRRAAAFTWERTADETLAVLRAHARGDGGSAAASAVHN